MLMQHIQADQFVVLSDSHVEVVGPWPKLWQWTPVRIMVNCTALQYLSSRTDGRKENCTAPMATFQQIACKL